MSRGVIAELSDMVHDARGAFRVWVVAAQATDGRWEAWLEFLLDGRGTSEVYATPIETRQQDRAAVERWASGVTHVYAEGALTRAALGDTARPASPLLRALEELVAALDRRIPQIDRAGETEIAADAAALRASAMHRLGILRKQHVDLGPFGGRASGPAGM